jgi:hypothetical protein
MLPGEAHIVAGEHGSANLNRLFEHFQSDSVARVLDPEASVLDVVPGASYAEDGPAPRHNVQRRDDLGQEAGVAICHAGDKGSELDPLRAGSAPRRVYASNMGWSGPPRGGSWK